MQQYFLTLFALLGAIATCAGVVEVIQKINGPQKWYKGFRILVIGIILISPLLINYVFPLILGQEVSFGVYTLIIVVILLLIFIKPLSRVVGAKFTQSPHSAGRQSKAKLEYLQTSMVNSTSIKKKPKLNFWISLILAILAGLFTAAILIASFDIAMVLLNVENDAVFILFGYFALFIGFIVWYTLIQKFDI